MVSPTTKHCIFKDRPDTECGDETFPGSLWCPQHKLRVDGEMDRRSRAWAKEHAEDAAEDEVRKLEDQLDSRLRREEIWKHRNDGNPEQMSREDQAAQDKALREFEAAIAEYERVTASLAQTLNGFSAPQREQVNAAFATAAQSDDPIERVNNLTASVQGLIDQPGQPDPGVGYAQPTNHVFSGPIVQPYHRGQRQRRSRWYWGLFAVFAAVLVGLALMAATWPKPVHEQTYAETWFNFKSEAMSNPGMKDQFCALSPEGLMALADQEVDNISPNLQGLQAAHDDLCAPADEASALEPEPESQTCTASGCWTEKG
jgi:hypothetical protein